jgi:uncharacterized lipoprotein YmbA
MKRLMGRILPLVLAGLTGCFSLSRETPVTEHYVLGEVLPLAAAPTVAHDSAGMSIGIRRPQVAAYLETPMIVVRHGPYRVSFSEYRRWGEDIGDGINRAVAASFARLPMFREVHTSPWPVASRHDYLVQLNVSRFEGVAPEDASAGKGEAHVQASWSIIAPLGGALLASGTTDHREPGWTIGDYAGLVALLDKGLDALARDVASDLGRLVSRP